VRLVYLKYIMMGYIVVLFIKRIFSNTRIYYCDISVVISRTFGSRVAFSLLLCAAVLNVSCSWFC
jgi:hypothetical protein